MYVVLLALLVLKLGPAKASHISLFGLLTNGLGGGYPSLSTNYTGCLKNLVCSPN